MNTSHSTSHIHLDLVGGLAGDMFIAAFLHAGLVTEDELSEVLSKVGIGTIKVLSSSVMRYGIESTHVSFMGWGAEQESDHRHLSEIQEMLRQSELPDHVRDRALSMFLKLGEVESKTHNIPLETVHFHEIGAIDSILDFVGAAYIIETCASSWSASRVPVGEGIVEMSHGPMPAMAPATAKLLEGFVLEPSGLNGELVTPTGATILKELGLSTPGLSVSGVLREEGFGAGTREYERRANVVRIARYEVASVQKNHDFLADTVTRLEADLDDMTAEALAFAEDILLKSGAIDVVRVATTMKKGRVGTRLSVLCRPEDSKTIAGLIFKHTSTFGLRVEEVRRWMLDRRQEEVETLYGVAHVKLGLLGDEIVRCTPEYEDCAELAREHQVSLKVVMDAVMAAANAKFSL